MVNGFVKFFNESKNYGFITSDEGKDYFFHISDVENNEVLNENQKISFETERGDRGEKAVKIKKLSDEEKEEVKEEKIEKEETENEEEIKEEEEETENEEEIKEEE